jgi:hypothetical protein
MLESQQDSCGPRPDFHTRMCNYEAKKNVVIDCTHIMCSLLQNVGYSVLQIKRCYIINVLSMKDCWPGGLTLLRS